MGGGLLQCGTANFGGPATRAAAPKGWIEATAEPGAPISEGDPGGGGLLSRGRTGDRDGTAWIEKRLVTGA